MKVILYMAISVNGYIAKTNNDTDWVCETDWDMLNKQIEQSDAVIMGRKTYEVGEEDFPYGNCLNIVLTRNKNLLKDKDNQLFTDIAPSVLLDTLEKKGKENILIIGGGEINRLFLDNNLVDELIFSVHPLVLGDGIRYSANGLFENELKLLDVKRLKQDLVQLKYRVLK